jgi:hypothetical protein
MGKRLAKLLWRRGKSKRGPGFTAETERSRRIKTEEPQMNTDEHG